MSSLSFRHLRRAMPAALIAVGLLLAGPIGPARAGPILDPLGDFLSTYTGPQDPGLDVVDHEVTLVGDRLNFFGRMAGPIAPTQEIGGLYLFGVDRGLGTPRFLNSPAAPPAIGPNVKWDSIVRILPNGTAFYLNSLLGVTTPLSTSDISIIGNEFNVSIPVSLMLPSATKPPEEWTYNLWPRNGVGLNVQVSDLAPDDGNSPVHAVPEPTFVTLCGIGALGLAGCGWRRRRHTARELVTRRQRKQNPMTKRWMVLVTASLATLLTAFFPLPLARADIFEWKYINPADPSQGKQQSTKRAPDGHGVDAVPGANLSYRNLTMAYLIGADLTGAYAEGANLTNADLSQANLTYAGIGGATLTGAEFTGAEVRGATLVGITAAQLYSTASYQAHDLTGIRLGGNHAAVNLAGQNLTNASFEHATLTNASFSQANLTNASFASWSIPYYGFTDLTGANFTNAQVRGADFHLINLSTAQLYSTASYQDHDLSGINFSGIDLTGVNLAGQNLTNASFTSNYHYPYWQTNLTDANLSGADLRGAEFSSTPLTGANFTGADVRGAGLGSDNGSSVISSAQLYSTASYQDHDLSGTRLYGIDLTGGNFAGFNLTNASLSNAYLTNANLSQANLTNASLAGAHLTNADLSGADAHGANFQFATLSGANLSQANLTNVSFAGYWYCDEFECVTYPGANFTNANLSGADARGADFFLATLTGANTSNLIQSNGHIAGLDLSAGASLVVRDYDGNPAASPPTGPLPIVVDQHLAMDTTGTLRLVFDADPWDSTISFAPGVPVALGGTLDLTFAPGVDIATQSGRTIDLFDWTGVTPTGAFTVSSPYTWNLTNLYTTGEVTLTAAPNLPGDFNHNGTVDAADYIVWRKNPGGIYTQNDFNIWRAHFGQTAGSGSSTVANAAVPEPSTLVMLVLAAAGVCSRRRRAAKTHAFDGTTLAPRKLISALGLQAFVETTHNSAWRSHPAQIEVPAPAPVALLRLGLIGVASRRRERQNVVIAEK